MRILCLLALLTLTACDWFGSPAPAPANVPAIQTETAALHALATAKAEVFPPTVTPPPPATQTAIAVHDAQYSLFLVLVNAQNEATSTAVYATLTALPQP